MCSKKDYIRAAKIITSKIQADGLRVNLSQRPVNSGHGAAMLEAFVEFFRIYPAFNEVRFRAACVDPGHPQRGALHPPRGLRGGARLRPWYHAVPENSLDRSFPTARRARRVEAATLYASGEREPAPFGPSTCCSEPRNAG